MTDDEIWALKRGGHDYRKVYAAYASAMEHTGQPTVVLAHTIKGYGLGTSFAGRNATHQMKKLKLDDLKQLRDLLHIPITDEQLERPLQRRRTTTRAWTPRRSSTCSTGARSSAGSCPSGAAAARAGRPCPARPRTRAWPRGPGKQKVATTMAFVRLLKDLMRDKEFGHRIVPIIPDEARTFGMDSIFPTAKIFNPLGQNYLSVDRELMLAYKESTAGQILHTGINEAGSAAAFQAAGTSYATHGEPMVPVYIFYSMFGFQRTGDQFWAAGDQMTRGFIIGATAGRTTLTGEGLQHADGHSPLLAATNPAVVHYDPAYGYEIAHIVRDGLERMYGDDGRDPNVMYYLTVYNEPMPAAGRAGGRRRRGHPHGHLHRIRRRTASGPHAQLLASGVGVPWALEAQQLLAEDWGVARRRVVGDVLERAAPRRRRRGRAQLPAPGGGAAHGLPHPEAARRRRARSSRRPTTTTSSRTRSASGSPATTRRWAPTASASPTPAPPPAGSSRSTARRWWSGPCRCSRHAGRSRARRAGRGDREVLAARRPGRDVRHGGRGLVS